MDTAPNPITAAGARPGSARQESTPAQRTNKTFQSSIFGGSDVAPTPAPARKSVQSSDIFGVSSRPTQAIQTAKNSHTYRSTVFDQEPVQKAQPVRATPLADSRIFGDAQVQPQRKIRNDEAKHKDHGQEYLFGKSDADDHKKSLKRVQTAKSFEPKSDYDPTNRHLRELQGTEITKDHLPLNNQIQQKKQHQTPKAKETYNPENRRQLENQSNIFGESKKPPLKQSNQRPYSSVHQTPSDPKTRKQRDNDSNVFGPQKKIDRPSQAEKPPTNSIYDVMGTKEPQQQDSAPKGKLIPSNAKWDQVDSIKNQEIANGEKEQFNYAEQKQQQNKSVLDTHNFQGQEPTEKVSSKAFRYKQAQAKKGIKKGK